MYIDYVIEENYHRIKDDISMILQSHGIGVESGAEEVSTDAGQLQVHEDDESQGSGPADGIVEEAELEAKVILPVDDEHRDWRLSSISMQEQVVESNRVLHK